LVRFLYSLLWYFLMPLIFLRLWIRGRKNPAYRLRWSERLAWFSGQKPVQHETIWVHTVSVGETLAAVPLIRALIIQYPQKSILVTSTTPTGSERVKVAFADQVTHCYLPYDYPNSVKRFLNFYQPQLCLILETELWPNFIYFCHQRSIPVMVANARLSQKSALGYQRFLKLSLPMLRQIEIIACQTEIDKERFVALGVNTDKIVVAGNIKYDLEIPSELIQQGKDLRKQIFPTQSKLWIAASTHHGEDEKLILIHQRILQKCPNAKLIIVPRHPERFAEVLEICQTSHLKIWQRSQGIPSEPEYDIFIGDSMGELLLFYAMADCAFIGGSLVNRGGHNLLEAEAFACPVVVGPYTYNFAEATRLMVDAGAAIQTDEGEMHFALIEWLNNSDACKEAGNIGKQIVIKNKGTLQKLLRSIEPLLLEK